GIRASSVTGVQTCALPISPSPIWFFHSLPSLTLSSSFFLLHTPSFPHLVLSLSPLSYSLFFLLSPSHPLFPSSGTFTLSPLLLSLLPSFSFSPPLSLICYFHFLPSLTLIS